VEVLRTVVSSLPEGLNAALFVVVHRAPESESLLARILSRCGKLPAVAATDGEPIKPSKIYVAPPDFHLVLAPGRMHLTHGPRENGFRPAVDPLFRSSAHAYRENVVGVILSGGLTDGAEGLRSIVESGGFAIVQDPREAPFQGMPASALELGPVDFTLTASEIGPKIGELAVGRVEKVAIPEQPAGPSLSMDETMGGKQTAYTCPECHGILWEVGEASKEYRCRVGHAFSLSSLLEAQDDGLERALFAALRSLEEAGSLARRLEDGARGRNNPSIARRFAERAIEKEHHAAVLRDLMYAPGRRLINAKTEATNDRPQRVRRQKAAK